MSRNYATVNPCTMCMPMGSVMVFKGIESCMPLFHGAQGCSTYMRLHLTHHFREPVDIASSALSEKGAVYGGAANLKQGLRNVIKGYGPKVVGVATTCLAETIGDDITKIVWEFKHEEPLAKDVTIVCVSTPSYAASHEMGYTAALKSVVQNMACRSKPNGKINLIVGAIVSPADIRYMKRLMEGWDQGHIIFPDISETLDAPNTGDLVKIPAGGTSIEDIKDMANSTATITIGALSQTADAGEHLNDTFDVHNHSLPLPIGLEYTDLFIGKMESLTDEPVQNAYELERGRLLDLMVDAHKLLAGVKTAVFGDVEIVLGLVKLMTELGMNPKIIATGTENQTFKETAKAIAPNSKVLVDTDFSKIGEEVAGEDIDLLVGPYIGRQLASKEKIPLLRVGLPNHDRFGASRQQILGYEGAMDLIDSMANTLLEHEGNNELGGKICIR